MDEDLEKIVDETQDPRMIPGIYNYCDRWCEYCAFTDRCATFRATRRYEEQHPDKTVLEQVHDSFQQTFRLIEAWCAREGIDFEHLRAEANSDESTSELRRLDETVDNDPLYKLAHTYSIAAFKVAEPLNSSAAPHTRSEPVRAATETVSWYSGFISVKVHRAIHGLIGRADDGIEWDAIQNDWNGSAKAARLAIAESSSAWMTILEAGCAPEDSPIRQMTHLLERIDMQLAARCPLAMQFVRPGFDEPDVAAGARTSLAPFEPRSG